MTDEPTDDGPVDAPEYDPFSHEFMAIQLPPSEPGEWSRPQRASLINPETLMLAFVAGNFSSAFLQTLGQRTADGVANLSKRG